MTVISTLGRDMFDTDAGFTTVDSHSRASASVQCHVRSGEFGESGRYGRETNLSGECKQ